MSPRTILHIDLDAFFCAVEELANPALHGKPFAVGGHPDQRGVVSSCSYVARKFGVRSAMPMGQALRLCPGLIVVSQNHGNYGSWSNKVMERICDLSPLVEQISVDEAFVDISDIREPPLEVAARLQKKIRDELGLPCSIGIASNKLTAKIANEVGKKSARGVGYPQALTLVPAGEEATFLAPLPAEMLWGVGTKTAERLKSLGITTIGQIAAWPEAELISRFGEHGQGLSRHARGLDDRKIESGHGEAKSISQETTYGRDVCDSKVLEKTVRDLSEQVGRRIRQSHLAGNTVKIKIRWADFTTLTRQSTLLSPTDQSEEIANAALELLAKVRQKGEYVRLIGVGVSHLREPVRQLELWDERGERQRRLQTTIDTLQEKFGRKAIQKARKIPQNKK